MSLVVCFCLGLSLSSYVCLWLAGCVYVSGCRSVCWSDNFKPIHAIIASGCSHGLRNTQTYLFAWLLVFVGFRDHKSYMLTMCNVRSVLQHLKADHLLSVACVSGVCDTSNAYLIILVSALVGLQEVHVIHVACFVLLQAQDKTV